MAGNQGGNNTNQGGRGSNTEGGNQGRSGNQGTNERGFAAMDPQEQRDIASKGGRAAHESGNAHEFTSQEAREAGRKGGEAGRGGGNQGSNQGGSQGGRGNDR